MNNHEQIHLNTTHGFNFTEKLAPSPPLNINTQ